MFDYYLTLLKQYIAIPSISTNPVYQPSIQACATWLHDLLQSHGFESQIISGYGNPVILAHYHVNETLPTCLIYGHYDVQPADSNEGRAQSPWDLQVTDDKLIARGAIDNKGQLMVHLATVLDLIVSGELQYNVTFLIEWDEETGWGNMTQFIQDYGNKLKADLCLVSDGELIGRMQPVVEVWFRGWANATLTLQTASSDAHSGIYGGILPNASHELVKLLSKLHTDDGQCVLYYWHEVNEATVTNNRQLPNVDHEILTTTWAKTLIKPDLDSYSVTGSLPTIQITGIESGYMWVGYRNAVPARASCKFNIRLTHNQDASEALRQIETRIVNQLPEHVDHTLQWSDSWPATIIDPSQQRVNHIRTILEQIFDASVPYKYCGGSLPIVWLLQDLGLACVLVPLANQDCLMHGVGENFALETLHKWLQFSRQFFSTSIS